MNKSFPSSRLPANPLVVGSARARRLVGPALFALGAAGLVLVPGLPPLCPMRLFFHVPCPGCGLTRAASLVLHGDFVEATHMFPLWFVVLPLVAFVFGIDTWRYVRTGEWGSILGAGPAKWIGLAVMIALVAIWVARFFGAFGGPTPV